MEDAPSAKTSKCKFVPALIPVEGGRGSGALLDASKALLVTNDALLQVQVGFSCSASAINSPEQCGSASGELLASLGGDHSSGGPSLGPSKNFIDSQENISA